MNRPSLSRMFVGGLVLVAMSGVAGAQSQSPWVVKGTQAMNELRARLDDPQQRAKSREDQRQAIAEMHYGVADALQLDAATFDKLMDLLVDQQLEQSDYFNALFAGEGSRDPAERMRDEAERVTKAIDAQREVLGQEKLERYQKLRFSLGQRSQIRELDERLGAADKLNGTQREQLVELLNEHIVASMERRHMQNSLLSPFRGDSRGLPSREEMLRRSQLQTITSNEQEWRDRPEWNRQLRERAAEFLTEPQLAMLAQMHEEQRATLQRHIEQMRMQAGMSPTIPEQAQVTEAAPATVNRDVKLSLMASVDKESPRYLTTVVSSGKSVSLKIAEGLFLQATPIVFENDAYNLRVEYYEEGVTGRRMIGNMGQSGTVAQASRDGNSRHVGGGGGSVVTGSKGYAVELSALVEST